MMKMAGVWNVVQGMKPAMLMVVVQMVCTGGNLLYKLAINDGMNLRIIIAYRYMFATCFVAPLALILERNKRPKMTWHILFQASLSGLFGGVMSQGLFLESLALASPTFASAMTNLTPAVTFLMAVCLRLDGLNIRTAGGKGKIIGTIISISGAMILTFFKGIKIGTGSFHVSLLHHQSSHVAPPHSSSGGKTLSAALCSLGSSSSYALWLIIQGEMSKNYPCCYSSTTLMNLNAALLSTVFNLCLERDWAQWKLGWDVRLLTAAFSGIVVSGATVVVTAWCLDTRGPLYVSAFNPLMLVFVALPSFFMLDEKLYLGSIIGGMSVVCGLYMVLWGKGKEMKKKIKLVPSQSLHEIEVMRSPTEDNNKICEVEFNRSSKKASEIVQEDI